MENTFKNAAEQSGPSAFDLAKALHEKLRYSNPALAFGVTQELILPELKDFGTDKALSTVLHALSPDTQNIETKNRIELPFASAHGRQSLRDLVFPEAKKYEESGSDSNRQLARILNSLSDMGRVDPIHAMRRHDTGDKVLHLPKDPDAAREEKWARERLQRGADYKKETLKVFTSELQGLLYDGRNMIGSQMQYALHVMREKIIGGDEVQKAASKVINDFGSVGALVRDGHNLKESIDILKRAEAMRAERKTKLTKEIS